MAQTPFLCLTGPQKIRHLFPQEGKKWFARIKEHLLEAAMDCKYLTAGRGWRQPLGNRPKKVWDILKAPGQLMAQGDWNEGFLI